MSPSLRRPRSLAALAAVAMLALAACSSGTAAEPGASDSGAPEQVKTLRLGFFPNLTHAPALVGLQEGLFKSALKDLGVTVTPTAFNAGPDAVSALFGNSLDISYIGPNPTINAYAESQGSAVRVIAGAASGGAGLVVRPEITSPAQLRGRTLATPQLGNTQDVALRYWLAQQGLQTDPQGGGDVAIVPQANAEGLTAYSSGQIDGAWVPEPWVSEYVKAGAKVLVDETTLWPEGKFVTTNVVVRTQFLQQHRDVVEAFLAGHAAALAAIAEDPKAAAQAANASLQSLTGSSIAPDVLDRAFGQIDFTADPLPTTLQESANHAISVGLLDEAKVTAAGGLPGTLYDLAPLNTVLKAAGEPEVSTP
ncbi:MAG TPA: ABC transporter substrate-binding protein [Candidatus Nanopelagicales bacterium]